MEQRVLFLHPYVPARFNGMPMGTLYVASAAEAQGNNVRFLDLQTRPGDNDLFDVLSDFRPNVVGLASTSPSHKEALRLARLVRAQLPCCIIVKGGVHETYCGEYTIRHNPEIDISIRGEAERSFPMFLSVLSEPSKWSEVPQLVYRCGSEIIVNGPEETTRSLDELRRPARHLIEDPNPYRFTIFHGRRTTQVQTMRGCSFQCSFCNQRRTLVRYRCIPSVLAELEELVSEGYEAVFFDDATFTIHRERIAELCIAIADRKFPLQFGCQTRSELIDERLAKLMGQAGFVYISFGLETTQEDALALFQKVRSTQKHLELGRSAVRVCRDTGIAVGLNLIVGLPSETDVTLRRTFDYVRDTHADYASLSVLALYPHEDPSLAAIYTAGVSEEPVWQSFDEGWGAVHPFVTADRAEAILELARNQLGSLLDVI